MITGDGNLLELQGTVRYVVRNARDYLFESREPEALVRSAGESVLRELVGSQTFARLLTTDRERFQREALSRLEKRVQNLGPGGLGIRLEGVALHDLHPPTEVVQAYHDVTRAMEARDRRINEATAAAMREEREQEARGLQTTRRAEAAHDEKITLTKARLDVFQARYSQRSQLSAAEENQLFDEALTHGRSSGSWMKAAEHYLQSRRAALEAQATLTDFRLYWDMLATALSGRDKILIDGKVSGRRHLWFLPDPPRGPVMGTPAPAPTRGREDP